MAESENEEAGGGEGEFLLTVRPISGRPRFHVRVAGPTTTLEEVQHCIAVRTGCAVQHQALIVEGKPLPVAQGSTHAEVLLQDCNVTPATTVHLIERGRRGESGGERRMRVRVNTLCGDPSTVTVSPEDPVVVLKRKIEEAIPELPAESQKILFAGRELCGEGHSLRHYSIQDASTVHVVNTDRAPGKSTGVPEGDLRFTVTVKRLAGPSCPVSVSGTDTVGALRAKLAGRPHMQATGARLIFAGRPLADDTQPLAEYGVRSRGTIHLIPIHGSTHGDEETLLNHIERIDPEPNSVDVDLMRDGITVVFKSTVSNVTDPDETLYVEQQEYRDSRIGFERVHGQTTWNHATRTLLWHAATSCLPGLRFHVRLVNSESIVWRGQAQRTCAKEHSWTVRQQLPQPVRITLQLGSHVAPDNTNLAVHTLTGLTWDGHNNPEDDRQHSCTGGNNNADAAVSNSSEDDGACEKPREDPPCSEDAFRVLDRVFRTAFGASAVNAAGVKEFAVRVAGHLVRLSSVADIVRLSKDDLVVACTEDVGGGGGEPQVVGAPTAVDQAASSSATDGSWTCLML